MPSTRNSRLKPTEAGDISLIQGEELVSGPGSSPVMAAFTHMSPDYPSRFNNGSYGIYYASKTLDTAIEEIKFHRTRFLAATNEEAGEISMRVYIGEIVKPLHDIRGEGFETLHDPDNWDQSQAFCWSLRESNAWGLVYRSVRHVGNQCIAILRPPAVTIPRQGPHLSYVWDGSMISAVYEKNCLHKRHRYD